MAATKRPKLVLRPQSVPESAEQIALARWLDFRRVLWCHVPNGEARDGRTGAKLKRMGVKRGVPDVLIFGDRLPGNPLPPVAIEMKSLSGALSDAQKGWLASLSFRGWQVFVARSALDAIQFLKSVGY